MIFLVYKFLFCVILFNIGFVRSLNVVSVVKGLFDKDNIGLFLYSEYIVGVLGFKLIF